MSQHQLQAQALKNAFVTLAAAIAAESAARSIPDHQPLPGAVFSPCQLILRSGVAAINDNVVGSFSDQETASLCGRFLMAIDSVYQPEYSHFQVLAELSPVSEDGAPMIRPGLYRHYKGGRYEVLNVATHSETQETMVVYRALYGDHGVWVRPLAMFCEEVIVEGRRQPRFTPE